MVGASWASPIAPRKANAKRTYNGSHQIQRTVWTTTTENATNANNHTYKPAKSTGSKELYPTNRARTATTNNTNAITLTTAPMMRKKLDPQPNESRLSCG